MQNPDRIRSTGTWPLVMILIAAITAPLAVIVGFPWVTRAQVAGALSVTPAEASEVMVFAPEVITLAEADAAVAAADAVSRHQCSPTTDEAGASTTIAVANPRFVPICDQRVGSIGDLAVAATYDAERGLIPFDVAEAVPPVVATYR